MLLEFIYGRNYRERKAYLRKRSSSFQKGRSILLPCEDPTVPSVHEALLTPGRAGEVCRLYLKIRSRESCAATRPNSDQITTEGGGTAQIIWRIHGCMEKILHMHAVANPTREMHGRVRCKTTTRPAIDRGRSDQQGGLINKTGMFLECKYEIMRWLNTFTACRRWRERHVDTEEDGHRHRNGRRDGCDPGCVRHHTDKFGLNMIMGATFANCTRYGEGEREALAAM